MDYNDIIETLKSIKTNPNLYIRKYPYYDIATSFIDGYLTSFAYRYNIEQKDGNSSLWLDVHDWYCKKLNKHFDKSLPDIVKDLYDDLQQKDLIRKYINVLIEFFNYKKEKN